MTIPVLFVFTISHYCEKAKWALDHLNIPYELKVLAPGMHVKIAKSLGLSRASVPFLSSDNGIIQGSNNIIGWAEKNTQNISSAIQTLGSNKDQVIQIEKRLDEVLGVHIRRWFYSEAVIEHPQSVRSVFMHNITLLNGVKPSPNWPEIEKMMAKSMDLGFEQGLESFDIVKQEVDWLSGLLAKDQSFLCDNRFSRADITAASLLAPVVAPPEHCCAEVIELPPRIQAQCQEMWDSPVWAWVKKLYSTHR